MPDASDSERDFWVGITAFGAVLGTGLYALVEHEWWFGGFYTIGGAVGLMWMSPAVRSTLGLQPSRIAVSAAIAVTWMFLAANLGVSVYNNLITPTVLLAMLAVIGIGLVFFIVLFVRQVRRQDSRIVFVRPQSLYLKDINIYAGSDGAITLNPRFMAKFTRNGKRARLYAEDRYYPAALMSPSLIRPPMVLLGEITDFVVGQSIDIAIMTPFETDGRKMWRWGTENTMFQSQASHHGRLVFLADDAAPEYFYFIIDKAPLGAPPHVVGQERFGFIQKWESENEQQA